MPASDTPFSPPSLSPLVPTNTASSSSTMEKDKSTNPAAAKPTRSEPTPSEEVDVWYGGYSSRAMGGAMTLSIVATLLLLALGWLIAAQLPTFTQEVWLGIAGVIGALWVFQIFIWIYRIVGFQMRLTTRRVFYDRGVLYREKKEVPLASVGRVEVVDQALDRFLGVGQLTLFGEGTAGELLMMTGVPQPRSVAELIRQHSAKVRESQIVEGKVKG